MCMMDHDGPNVLPKLTNVLPNVAPRWTLAKQLSGWEEISELDSDEEL